MNHHYWSTYMNPYGYLDCMDRSNKKFLNNDISFAHKIIRLIAVHKITKLLLGCWCSALMMLVGGVEGLSYIQK